MPPTAGTCLPIESQTAAICSAEAGSCEEPSLEPSFQPVGMSSGLLFAAPCQLSARPQLTCHYIGATGKFQGCKDWRWRCLSARAQALMFFSCRCANALGGRICSLPMQRPVKAERSLSARDLRWVLTYPAYKIADTRTISPFRHCANRVKTQPCSMRSLLWSQVAYRAPDHSIWVARRARLGEHVGAVLAVPYSCRHIGWAGRGDALAGRERHCEQAHSVSCAC